MSMGLLIRRYATRANLKRGAVYAGSALAIGAITLGAGSLVGDMLNTDAGKRVVALAIMGGVVGAIGGGIASSRVEVTDDHDKNLVACVAVGAFLGIAFGSAGAACVVQTPIFTAPSFPAG